MNARKSYFIIDDTIYCLGSGMIDKRSELGGDIKTTLNQTAWRNTLHYGTPGSSESFEPGNEVSQIKYP